MVSTGIIIQARSDSSRFPGKGLQLLVGKPVIFHVIERCKRIKHCDKVILATTVRKIDDSLADIARECGIEIFRGSTLDVLDRYYQCAGTFGLGNIVRITGDCPVIDISISNKVIDTFLKSNYDFVRTGLTYPDGVNTEVFSFDNLDRAWNGARLQSEREHVTPYFWKNPSKFKILSIESNFNLSHMNFALDYPEDLVFIQKLYGELYYSCKYFGLEMILTLLRKNNKLMSSMPKSKRYEGYYKSIRHDDSK